MAVTAVMGLLVAYLSIPSIVVTLGMLSILKGGLISSPAAPGSATCRRAIALAQMEPLGVPMPIWFMVVLTAGGRVLDALQRPRPQHLRRRRQRRGRAARRHHAGAGW